MSCILMPPYSYSNFAASIILLCFCWSITMLAYCRNLLVTKSVSFPARMRRDSETSILCAVCEKILRWLLRLVHLECVNKFTNWYWDLCPEFGGTKMVYHTILSNYDKSIAVRYNVANSFIAVTVVISWELKLCNAA